MVETYTPIQEFIENTVTNGLGYSKISHVEWKEKGRPTWLSGGDLRVKARLCDLTARTSTDSKEISECNGRLFQYVAYFFASQH